MPRERIGSKENTEKVIEIVNEFTMVRIRKLGTADGDMLEISSPKLGYVVRLKPEDVEHLASESISTFSAFLESPYG